VRRSFGNPWGPFEAPPERFVRRHPRAPLREQIEPPQRIEPQRIEPQRIEPQPKRIEPRRVAVERSLQPVRPLRPVEPLEPLEPAAAVEPASSPSPSIDVDEIERIKARVSREGEREVERKTREVLVGFLDVVDDLDRAIANADAIGEADRALMNGVEMVRASFLDKLAKHGVEQDGAVGDVFDPKRHEALATGPAPTQANVGRVIAIVRPGYRIDGELLRPASVVVGTRR
jgi:molecular chaperone GrpE